MKKVVVCLCLIVACVLTIFSCVDCEAEVCVNCGHDHAVVYAARPVVYRQVYRVAPWRTLRERRAALYGVHHEGHSVSYGSTGNAMSYGVTTAAQANSYSVISYGSNGTVSYGSAGM